MEKLRWKIYKWAFENTPTQTCGGSVGCSKCSCFRGNDKVMPIQKILEDPNSSIFLKIYAFAAKCEKCDHYLREHTWYI